MSNYNLKMIALITMTIDHIGFFLLPEIIELRIIGRISFFLYSFLLVEGFSYTKDKIKHLKIIFLYAIVIQLGMILYNVVTGEYIIPNIFLTLSLGLFIIYFLEYKYYILCFLMFIFISPFVDYSFYGVSLIVVMYLFRNLSKYLYVLILILHCLVFVELDYVSKIQSYSLIGLFFILIYNNKLGKNNKVFFYMYYPIHIIIINLIGVLI